MGKNRQFSFAAALIIAVASISATSCSREKLIPEPGQEGLVEKTFSAEVQTEEEHTRTTLSGKKVIWSEDDRLLVFDYASVTAGKCSEGHLFNLTAGAGTSKGTFTGKVHNSDKYCAIVVNSKKDLCVDNRNADVFIPTMQHPVAGSFEDKVNPAFGVADATGNLVLRNLGVLVKIKVSAANIVSIKLSSNDGSAMTGMGKYAIADAEASFNGTPDVSCVELYPADAEYFSAGGTYYAIIYPTTHAGGLTVEYRRNNGGTYQIGSITSTNSVTVNKNNILDLGSPDTKVSSWKAGSNVLLDLRFNEDGSATDISGYNREVIDMGGAKGVYCEQTGGFIARFENDMSFNSQDKYYKVDYSNDTQLKNAIKGSHSWEAYFMPRDTTNWWTYKDDSGSGRLVSVFGACSRFHSGSSGEVDNRGGSGLYLNTVVNSHAISFGTRNPSDNWKGLNSGIVPLPGIYRHVVATYNSSTRAMAIYVDGVKKGSTTAAAAINLPSQPELQWIGIAASAYKNDQTAYGSFDGDIAVARFYNKTLSDSEVSSLFSSLKKIDNEAGVLLDVRFNTDGSAWDASQYKRTITTMGTAPDVLYNSNFGGYTACFDNVTEEKTSSGYYRVSYKNDPSLVNSMKAGFTIETYAKTNLVKSQKIYGNTQGAGTEIGLNGEGKLMFEVYDSGRATPGYASVKTPAAAQANRYYHIVGVADPAAGNIKMYVDGKLINTSAFTGPIVFPMSATTSWVGIGADCYSSDTQAETPFNGSVAMIKVYDKPLSESQVKALERKLNKITDDSAVDNGNLLLNVKFDKEGKAYDASGRHRMIENIDGFGTQTWFSSERNDYIAAFTNKVATSRKTGFYKYDYSTDKQFMEALTNGTCTFETYMCIDAANTNFVKFLGAQETGGVALSVRTTGKFGVEVITNNGSANVSVNMEGTTMSNPREYHHVVAVIDHPGQKVSLYIDGKQEASKAMTYPFQFPADSKNWWLGIGADAGSSGQNCLYGEIAYVKVYDKALSSSEVASAYADVAKVSDNTPERPIKISIIGDSISTFKGYIPDGYVAHYPNDQSLGSDHGITEVEQTYWWKLIYNKLDNAMFDTNIAWSGSTVCDDGYKTASGVIYPCFIDRLLDYGIGNPDVILIHGGTNDWAHNLAKLDANSTKKIKSETAPISDARVEQLYSNRATVDYKMNFSGGLTRLLYETQKMYPSAKIIYIIGDYMNDATYKTILKIVKKFGIKYVDLMAVNGFQDLGGNGDGEGNAGKPPYTQPNMPKHDFDLTTPGISGCHPGLKATEFIAQKIYDEMHEYIESRP